MKGKPRSVIDWRQVLGPIVDVLGGADTPEVAELEAAIASHSRRAVRLQPWVMAAELPFDTDEVPWFSRGRFLLDGRTRPGSFLEFAGGDYFIQDAGSLLPLALAQIQPGEYVCDLCAAPGGKSTAILEQLQGSGVLLSNEVIRSRVDVLELALARSGYSNYCVTNRSIEAIAEFFTGPRFDGELEQERLGPGRFDCVVVDAPCTGQSMIARGKQSLAAFTERQITHSAARQQSILRAALRLVRPGGRLIYSTCTFAYEENEGIVKWMRELVPDWLPLEKIGLQQWQTPGWPGCYRLWPHRDGCSGGFAAGLVRPSDSPTEVSYHEHYRSLSPARNSRPSSSAGSVDLDLVSPWAKAKEDGCWWLSNASLEHVYSTDLHDWRDLGAAGVRMAERIGDHWLPSYAAACLRNESDWWTAQARIELSDEQAVRFMAGEGFTKESPAGWVIVQWKGRPLAWGKHAGGVLKNHLPKGLRGHYQRIP